MLPINVAHVDDCCGNTPPKGDECCGNTPRNSRKNPDHLCLNVDHYAQTPEKESIQKAVSLPITDIEVNQKDSSNVRTESVEKANKEVDKQKHISSTTIFILMLAFGIHEFFEGIAFGMLK